MLCHPITTSFVTVPAAGLELLGFNVKLVCPRETTSSSNKSDALPNVVQDIGMSSSNGGV